LEYSGELEWGLMGRQSTLEPAADFRDVDYRIGYFSPKEISHMTRWACYGVRFVSGLLAVRTILYAFEMTVLYIVLIVLISIIKKPKLRPTPYPDYVMPSARL